MEITCKKKKIKHRTIWLLILTHRRLFQYQMREKKGSRNNFFKIRFVVVVVVVFQCLYPFRSDQLAFCLFWGEFLYSNGTTCYGFWDKNSLRLVKTHALITFFHFKILDFGLARKVAEEMTGYVTTRWYRAPEIMLNWMHYDQTGLCPACSFMTLLTLSFPRSL